MEKRKPSYEELEQKCQRQATRIKGLRKALRNLEKKHGYAQLREMASIGEAAIEVDEWRGV